MGVNREVRTANSIPIPGNFAIPSGQKVAFGAALVGVTFTHLAETVQAMPTAAAYMFGWAGRRVDLFPKGAYDGFWGYKDPVPVWRDEAIGLVTPNNTSDANIDFGDYLEPADLGSGAGAGAHGILEEAGSQAGKTYTDASLAMALESVTMKGAKHPASTVAIGDETITTTSGETATMGLTKGDLILLEDDNGNVQVNAIYDLTATLITLLFPSTVALGDVSNDKYSKIYQCLMRQVI